MRREKGHQSRVLSPSRLNSQLKLTIGAAVEVRPSFRGMHHHIPITGGTFWGRELRAWYEADWQEPPDGMLEIDSLYSIKVDDRQRNHRAQSRSGSGRRLLSLIVGPFRNLRTRRESTLGSI